MIQSHLIEEDFLAVNRYDYGLIKDKCVIRRIYLKPDKIKYLIIYHSATARDTTTFDAIKIYHTLKGLGDIGYHFFITASGKVMAR